MKIQSLSTRRWCRYSRGGEHHVGMYALGACMRMNECARESSPVVGRMATQFCEKSKRWLSASELGASLMVFTTMQPFMPWQSWLPCASAICATSARPECMHTSTLSPALIATISNESTNAGNMCNSLFISAKLRKRFCTATISAT